MASMAGQMGQMPGICLANWAKRLIIVSVSIWGVRIMPLYEYECQECGLRFERRQSFSDPRITECPECDGPVIRLIQPAGIIFKGSGFYVTDNRKKSPTATPGSRMEDKDKGDTSTSDADKKTSTTTSSKKDDSSKD
jgi:putative FmdB family regulatory protein